MLYIAFAIIYLTFYFIFETIWAHSFLYITLVVVTYYMVMALYTVSSTWFLVTNKNLVIIMPTLSASFFHYVGKVPPVRWLLGQITWIFKMHDLGSFQDFTVDEFLDGSGKLQLRIHDEWDTTLDHFPNASYLRAIINEALLNRTDISFSLKENGQESIQIQLEDK